MFVRLRRGGGGSGPGRGLFRAGLLCLVAAGCATDPPPALLTLVDAERLTVHDSELIPDSAKNAIRTYLGRLGDSVWELEPDPSMERIVGDCRGLTAILNPEVLPPPGRNTRVLVDVPDQGAAEFRIARVDDQDGKATYTGESVGGQMSIVLVRDSIFEGRISSESGTFDFRSGRLGLLLVEPLNTSYVLPELHLVRKPPKFQLVARANAAERPRNVAHRITC